MNKLSGFADWYSTLSWYGGTETFIKAVVIIISAIAIILSVVMLCLDIYGSKGIKEIARSAWIVAGTVLLCYITVIAVFFYFGNVKEHIDNAVYQRSISEAVNVVR